jgi:hypothetical protein
VFNRRYTALLGAFAIAVLNVTSPAPALGANVIVFDAHFGSPDDSGQPAFGQSVAIEGDTAVVGAPQDNGGPANFVGVYVYERSSSGWGAPTQLSITLPSPADLPLMGASVSISGDTIAVGAPSEDIPDPENPGSKLNRVGAVYVFIRNGSGWSQQARLTALQADENDFFGTSVVLNGDTLAIAARGEDGSSTGVNGDQSSDGAPNSGAVYVFERSGASWSQTAYLKASNTGADDLFGWGLGLDGDTLAVGARGEDSAATGVGGNQSDESAHEAGAAYVFVRSAGLWAQQAYLKPSNTRENFVFGCSVAVSGDTVVVGAPGENSNSTGVGGNESNTQADQAGAAYVFTRSGVAWTQQAYVKASNTDPDDEFGGALALRGDRLVVGAANEASAASGINGIQADNSAGQAGAAYVYGRTSGAWTQRAYVKAAQSTGFAQFGSAVALTGSRLFVGAPYDDVGELNNVGGADMYRWVDDTTAPETGPVNLAIPAGQQVSDAPVLVSWTAHDDLSTAAQLRHTVEIRHRISGSWSSWQQLATDLTSTNLLTHVSFGKTYQWRVRTRDDGGNIGAWSTSELQQAVLRQESKFALTGHWNVRFNGQSLGKHEAYSSSPGSNARLKFSGVGVAAVMWTDPSLGTVRICVDKGTPGEACKVIDLGADPHTPREIVAAFDDLSTGAHKLDVTVKTGSAILDGAIVWK